VWPLILQVNREYLHYKSFVTREMNYLQKGQGHYFTTNITTTAANMLQPDFNPLGALSLW
jgi:hypothetical protein